MKSIITILLLISTIVLNAQNFVNDTSNTHFYNAIKKQNHSKNLTYILYNIKYKMIFNKGVNNYLSNKNDSLKILTNVQKNDSVFNIKYLIDKVKNKNAVMYEYYNPSITYDNSNIQSLIIYPNADTITSTLNSGKKFIQLVGHFNEGVAYDSDSINYYHVFLGICKNRKGIKQIKILGVIPFLSIFDAATGDFLGMKGLGCFVFK